MGNKTKVNGLKMFINRVNFLYCKSGIAFPILWLAIIWQASSVAAQNAPVVTAGILSTSDTLTTLELSGSGFTNISSCNLSLSYDPAIAKVVSVAPVSALGGNISTDLTVPGVINLGWYCFPAKTIEGNPPLFNIVFRRERVGTSLLAWSDSNSWYDGNYTSLNDMPASAFYINGSLTFVPGTGISEDKKKEKKLNMSCTPNPFNDRAELTWVVREKGEVTVEVSGLTGVLIKTLVDETELPGCHSVALSPLSLGHDGVCFVRIIMKTAGEQYSECTKIVSFK